MAASTPGLTRPPRRRAASPPASRTCRTSPCAHRWAAKSGAHSSRDPDACSWTRTIRRSSCACSRTCRATRRCAMHFPAVRTCTPARPPRSTACRLRRSRRRCAPAPRPSTSALSTASAISAWPPTCTFPARRPPSSLSATSPATARCASSWTRASRRARPRDTRSRCTAAAVRCRSFPLPTTTAASSASAPQ